MVSAHRFVDPHADAKGTWPHSALRHPTAPYGATARHAQQGTSKGGHPAGAAREPQAADQALAFFQTLVGYMLDVYVGYMLDVCCGKHSSISIGHIHWNIHWKYTYSKCLVMNWEKGNHLFYPFIRFVGMSIMSVHLLFIKSDEGQPTTPAVGLRFQDLP